MAERFAGLKEFWKKHGKRIILVFFIIAVATLFYGLGYMDAYEKQRAPIIIEKYSQD